jgi:hypothetical protein
MPLHLILIMLGLVGFLLWLAFAESDETELGFAEGVEEDGPRPEAPHPETR